MSGKDNEARPAKHISLDELSEPTWSWKIWLAWVGVVAGAFWVFAFSLEPNINTNEDRYFLLLMGPIQGVVAATMYYGGYVWIRKQMYRSMLKRATASELEQRAESLQDDLEQDFFNNLVKINFKYIDKYYLQTQIQADKAFMMCAIAAFVGFVVIIAGVVQMYVGEVRPAYVTTATGVLSEFVAIVFFYLYNQTIQKMADYHKKLVLTQNVGLALRITQDLPDEQRVTAQCSLADRLSADINALLAGSARES